eukprot:CAMPEP_0170552432 /NCGR_PEP_ID=MMETSP0211-20121228/10319_1 /TAXON_ID=311385 /ORGANISM="Pseudokeronopsis sp., Strain OXSARD2" /LENGTH=142 /DNA_ID=CAMNT_0010860149 /DNA_START=1344 /DNA_END=1772 /DNA_ORIENTATION=+
MRPEDQSQFLESNAELSPNGSPQVSYKKKIIEINSSIEMVSEKQNESEDKDSEEREETSRSTLQEAKDENDDQSAYSPKNPTEDQGRKLSVKAEPYQSNYHQLMKHKSIKRVPMKQLTMMEKARFSVKSDARDYAHPSWNKA